MMGKREFDALKAILHRPIITDQDSEEYDCAEDAIVKEVTTEVNKVFDKMLAGLPLSAKVSVRSQVLIKLYGG